MQIRKQHYKASGGYGIPVKLFQILKDDAVKVLHSICQQIWKTQQWLQDWKRSVFIPIPKKGNAKEYPNYHRIALISHTSKVTLKILQARLQQYMNWELPDVQDEFRKGRGIRNQIANIHWIIEKAREYHKNIYMVKGFGIVNKAEIDVFLEFFCFSMIQWMLAIWSLFPLLFLKLAWTSGSSWFMYCWSLAWRILSITLLECEMSAIVW